MTLGCVSCHDDLNPETAIVGKYKLVKAVPITRPESYECSQYNIMFEFKTNGTLTVSGKTDQANIYVIPEGDYLYLLKNSKLRIKSDMLFQGKLDFWYNLSSKEITLSPALFSDDMSDLDGSIDGGNIWFFIKKK
jgi:hypothetical protein